MSAEYWDDFKGTDTPPGHWNRLAEEISQRDQHDLDQDVKMFFALNAAEHDTSVSVWEAKRFYDYIRPISAVREFFKGKLIQGWGGPGKGITTIGGSEWTPWITTTPHSEFPSGHSAYSNAAAGRAACVEWTRQRMRCPPAGWWTSRLHRPSLLPMVRCCTARTRDTTTLAATCSGSVRRVSSCTRTISDGTSRRRSLSTTARGRPSSKTISTMSFVLRRARVLRAGRGEIKHHQPDAGPSPGMVFPEQKRSIV